MSDNYIVRGQKGYKNGFCILDLIPMTSTHSYFVFSSVHTTYGTILSVTTLGCIMFGPFWSVWCKIALAEVGMSLP